MHRIDSSTATIDNKFTNGNPSTATPATVVTDSWLNAVQEEIVTVISAAGIALSKPNNAQLLAALQALFPATPAGVMAPFAGSAAPTGWLLCAGQAVSRTTYAALFTAIGTTWGAGDGSTTFNLPDMRGRVPAGADNMGGNAANRLNVTLNGTTTNASVNITGLSSTVGLTVGMQVFGTGIPAGATIATITSATAITISANATASGTVALRFGIVDGATLAAAGGTQAHTLTTGQMPSHTHGSGPNNGFWVDVGGRYVANAGGSVINLNNVTATAATGGDQAHPNVQPTVITNYIIKT